ncbi:MAG: cell division protein FtsQ [Saprospiraceae bacterium]|nr:cell division protein FtsQ [Saprospiraceae bacterium]
MTEQKSYKIDRKKLAVAIGAGLTVLLVLFFTFRKKRSDVKDVIVDIQHLPNTKNDLIKDKDVKEIIRRAFDVKIENEPLGQVDVARIEQVLEQDPFVQNAETFVDVKGNLNLKITQRQPILRVIDDNNLNYYLDKDGFKMPLSKYYSARVPIVTGAVPPYVSGFLGLKKYALKDVFYLVQRLNADAFFAPMLQQIVIDAAGEFTIIPILGDQKIRIGTLDDLDEKLERLKLFYKEAMPYEGWKKYKSISVKYKGQIVCKKK